MAQTAASNGKGATPEAAQHDLDALRAQIATLREDLSELAGLAGEIGARRGQAAKARAEAQAQEWRGQGEAALREAGRRMAELEDEAAGQVRAHPFQAVGLAAAAGFLVGYLGARR